MPSDNNNRAPTSVVLQRLLAEAPGDYVTPGWILAAVPERAFGLLILVLGLMTVLPSICTVAAFLLVFPALQMVVAREAPTLPRWFANWRLATPRLAGLAVRVLPALRRMEALVQPRRGTSTATQRLVGGVILLLGLSILSPMPLSNVPPGLAIMLLAFGYLEEDRRLLAIGLAAAAMSLIFTAGTVWGAVAGVSAL